jgi:hypothetical protein
VYNGLTRPVVKGRKSGNGEVDFYYDPQIFGKRILELSEFPLRKGETRTFKCLVSLYQGHLIDKYFCGSPYRCEQI